MQYLGPSLHGTFVKFRMARFHFFSFMKILLRTCDTKIGATSWENQQSAYAKTKTQISFAVTAKLISAFVFATRIVQFLLYLNPKFQASSSFLCLYRPVCVGPVRKPHCWFSHEAAHWMINPMASVWKCFENRQLYV